jgi:hypothetical protein
MTRKARLTLLLAVGLTLLPAVSGGLVDQASAHKRGTLNVRESAALKVTENNEETRDTVAAGTGTGTFDGQVHLRVHVINGSKLSARFVSAGRGGSFVGSGGARYSVSGSILRFFGTVTVAGGTGKYANARGHGIEIEGALNRVKERMTMTLKGTISY